MTNVPEYHSLSDAYQTGLENGKALSAATVAELRAEVERRKDALAAMSQFAKVAEQRADAAERRVGELKSRIQSALANVAVPKMSESRAEYFKAGARAAIAAVNDALTGADPT